VSEQEQAPPVYPCRICGAPVTLAAHTKELVDAVCTRLAREGGSVHEGELVTCGPGTDCYQRFSAERQAATEHEIPKRKAPPAPTEDPRGGPDR